MLTRDGVDAILARPLAADSGNQGKKGPARADLKRLWSKQVFQFTQNCTCGILAIVQCFGEVQRLTREAPAHERLRIFENTSQGIKDKRFKNILRPKNFFRQKS